MSGKAVFTLFVFILGGNPSKRGGFVVFLPKSKTGGEWRLIFCRIFDERCVFFCPAAFFLNFFLFFSAGGLWG